MAGKSEHDGHRKRMRERYLSNSGFDGFHAHEVLEMLLYHTYPRGDTNPIAHKLLDQFGSLSAIFDAPYEALLKAGLTERAAVYFNMVPEITRLYLDDKHKNKSKIVDLDNLGGHLVSKFVGRETEVVVLLLLDSKGKELFCGVVSKGSINSSDVPIREIVGLALRFNAATAAIAHNHPSGVAIPSKDDIRVTKEVHDALKLVGVRLKDHLIFADNDYVSLADSQFDVGVFYTNY